MNNKLTLLAALLLFGSYYSTAQIIYSLDEGDSHGNGTQIMVGQREYKWDVDTLNWDDVDSFYLQYNGQDQLVLINCLTTNTSIGDPWKRFLLSQRMYDANGNLQLQVDTSSNPTMGDRYEFTYNSSNLEIQKLEKAWNTSLANWINYRRYTTTYTAFDKVNVYFTEGWNISNVWQNYKREIHTYNAQNLDSIITYENWDNVNSLWEGVGRYLYTYDANGNRTVYVYEQYDVALSIYKPVNKYEYTYDGSNRMTTYIQYDWNVNTNLWVAKWKYTYAYNAQGMLEGMVNEKWIVNNLQWDLWTNYIYTFDANNRPATDLYQNRVGNAWENSGRYTYTRNANGYLTRKFWESWNTNTISWRNWGAIDYWYANRVTPNTIQEQTEDILHVYPNPANSPVVFVNAESNLPYTIYDLTGRQVTQGKLQPGTNSIILDEAKGIYLLKAGNSTTKIVKQ